MAAVVSWYDVLQVPRDARAEDIKAAYHALLLRLHPDKRSATSGDTQQQQQQQVQYDKQQFHLVQLAWKVLSTPALREVHDRELAQAELRSVLTYQDELDIDEMESEAGDDLGQCYTYNCRCGDLYRLPARELEAVQANIAVPCRSCSNHILVRAPTRPPGDADAEGG